LHSGAWARGKCGLITWTVQPVESHAGLPQLMIQGVPNWSVSTPNRRAQ
jgi:hypothetical protein